MKEATKKGELSPEVIRALQSALSNPEVISAASEAIRKAAQSLPESLELFGRSMTGLPERIEAHRVQVKQEIERGARAVGPNGKVPSGRIV